MKFWMDLHCHTSEISGCASEGGVDTAEKYVALGYDSVVISNHFSRDRMLDGESYCEYVDRFFDAIEIVREAAGDRLAVIDGMELSLEENRNEYLIIGLSREIMHRLPCLFSMSIEEAHEVLSEAGCLVIQAHPMRWGMTTVRPEWVDGYEVLNTHTAHDSHNAVARLWADTVAPNHIQTAGSDHHDAWNIPTSGIVTEEKIETAAQLAEVMRKRKFGIEVRSNVKPSHGDGMNNEVASLMNNE